MFFVEFVRFLFDIRQPSLINIGLKIIKNESEYKYSPHDPKL